MNVIQSSHQFADATTARVQGLQSNHCQLTIVQKPVAAKVAVGKEKDRKPVDPPPIIQLKISPQHDPNQSYLQSPYFFMSCSLVTGESGNLPPGPLGTALAGTLVSSLHRLKSQQNEDGAYFVFGDLSIKIEGVFRLQFNLYEMRDQECFHMKSCTSEPFTVHPQKNFPGMSESTFMTRSFSDQGVRLRLRKEPRTLLRKRGPASDDYQPRTYHRSSTTQNRQQSQGTEYQGSESQDPSRHNQAEHTDTSIQLPIHPHHTYDQRAHTGRNYSQSTIMTSFSDDASNKRPRTGSEQSAAFNQQPLESPQYPTRMFTDTPSFNSQFSPQPQQQNFGYYSQSPQSSYSPFDNNPQRSPQSQYFPPQNQTIRYSQQQPLLAPSPPRVPGAHNPYEGLGINTRIAPAMHSSGLTGMQPPTYGRTNTTPTYGSSPYVEYPAHTGAVGSTMLGSRGPSMGTTSAPGL